MRKIEIAEFLKNRKAAAAAAVGAALLGFGVTWAFYGSDHTALANHLSTAHSGAAMVEEFHPEDSFLPGETVVKKVAFQNTGDMDLFLRVEVPPEEAWYDAADAVHPLDTDRYLPEAVIKNWTSVWPKSENDFTGQWSQIFTDSTGKQYRYYRKILKPKEQTDCILDSIRLSEEVSNDRHALNYSDKIYKLTFNAEAVPVEGNEGQPGVQAAWAMSVTAAADGTLTWTQN